MILMHLNGVLVMTIETYKLNLMKAALKEHVVTHMDSNDTSKSFNVGTSDRQSFLGAWDLEYSIRLFSERKL